MLRSVWPPRNRMRGEILGSFQEALVTPVSWVSLDTQAVFPSLSSN